MNYPNNKIEFVESWLTDIEFLKNKINDKSDDQEDIKLDRIKNFVERSILQFNVFEEQQFMRRFSIYEKEYTKEKAWDDLNLIRDILISERVNLLEDANVIQYQFLLELAKREAKVIGDQSIVEALDEIEVSEVVQDRGLKLTRILGKVNTVVSDFVLDGIEAVSKGATEGAVSAILSYFS